MERRAKRQVLLYMVAGLMYGAGVSPTVQPGDDCRGVMEVLTEEVHRDAPGLGDQPVPPGAGEAGGRDAVVGGDEGHDILGGEALGGWRRG